MSGHSKWHNIRVRKTAADAARGKVYTRHARLIEMAVRSSGNGDLDTNPSLRTVVDNAKADNVPNANIDRAIKKGLGELKGEQMREMVYAAYGPGGAAFLIECLTDNHNRTLGNIKGIIREGGGNWAESGSVAWMFERKGMVTAHKEGAGKGIEEVELELIDFGAEDIDANGDSISVTTDVGDWTAIRDFLKENGWTVDSSGLKFLPTQKQAISDLETAQKVMAFMEALEEDEDVSQAHTNAEIAADVMAKME